MTAPAPVAGVGVAAKGPRLRARIVGAPLLVTASRVAAALPALALVTVTVSLALSTVRAIPGRRRHRAQAQQQATSNTETAQCTRYKSSLCTSDSYAESTKKTGISSGGASENSLQVCVTLGAFWSETRQGCMI